MLLGSFPALDFSVYSPIVVFPPGAYLLSRTLKVYNGLTLTGLAGATYTVEHTRLIMDTAGGTKNQNTSILQITCYYPDPTHAIGSQLVTTIEDLAFWTPGWNSNVHHRGDGSNWNDQDDPPVDLSGNPTHKGLACHIYTNEAAGDMRICRCTFYEVPLAAILFNTPISAQPTGADAFIYECEFDGSNRQICANNRTMHLHISNNEFFGGYYHFRAEKCQGHVSFSNNLFSIHPRITITNSYLNIFSIC